MAIRVALTHRSTYSYSRPIELGPQIVRLRPCQHTRTPIHSFGMDVQPTEHFCNWQQDPNGNFQARLVFPKQVKHFAVTINLVVDMVVFNPFDFFIEQDYEAYPFAYKGHQKVELRPFLAKRRAGERFGELLASIDRSKRRSIDFLCDLNQLLERRIAYTIRMKPGVQSPETTLKLGSGSCRDSAWLLVQLLRHLGIAARFVSGYLIQLTPDKEAVDGPQYDKDDFCDLHAWCEAYIPGAGWIGLDPTSGLLAGEGHIPVACAPDPVSAAPISGSHEACKVTFEHDMHVTRLADAGRAGRPYEDADWQAINDLGQTIDTRMQAADMRLTMGGEPTFVASRDPDGEEWNTAALGPTKAGLADQLLRQLVDDWAPGAVLHHGQGKWYPGEELPRWAYSAYWRKDGEALWQDTDLLAPPEPSQQASIDQSQQLLQTLAQELGLDESMVFPAYEDPWYYSWRERRLPTNVDPLESKLDDERERRRLATVFERGLHKAVGHVLPLTFVDDAWQTGKWFLRQEHCYLLPGDSPMGFRLPLDSQPWQAPEERQPPHSHDPSHSFATLPPRPQQRHWPAAESLVAESPQPNQSAKDIVRTALSVELRDGGLWVFLPPLEDAGPFIDLIAAIERAAKHCHTPIRLEGYPAPFHPELCRMAITPDPGVIEVNVPPVTNWQEQVDQFSSLYDKCHHLHLAADKFDVDGRHTGTGGGCHVVIGGATPADSPWLRRPELLSSLLSYWVNHPSLTYVFSGGFVGPTSQAPRLDEARQESVAELELALAELRRRADTEHVPPWLLDRTLRHLLIDVTGNTHRAEICIDKLYNPDSSTGRLGLVELRSFEMPPHWQMACSQNLLVRALLLKFWQQPYQHGLARWGSMLHDRWMLPRFLDLDLQEVCQDLNKQDLPIQAQWFQPHSQFRMPVLGSFVKDGIHVELRQAIEPWHVLGEEASGGGQARYVDSSCERLQVLVRGADRRRYAITCNGYRVPLTPTGIAGELVAGIRYRAWQPPSCLHPTIPVDTPLTIDLYDEHHNRAIAGASYHVSHPGGRAFDTRPINANEAEGRRLKRFDTTRHGTGRYRPRDMDCLPESPMTLDLRHAPKADQV